MLFAVHDKHRRKHSARTGSRRSNDLTHGSIDLGHSHCGSADSCHILPHIRFLRICVKLFRIVPGKACHGLLILFKTDVDRFFHDLEVQIHLVYNLFTAFFASLHFPAYHDLSNRNILVFTKLQQLFSVIKCITHIAQTSAISSTQLLSTSSTSPFIIASVSITMHASLRFA